MSCLIINGSHSDVCTHLCSYMYVSMYLKAKRYMYVFYQKVYWKPFICTLETLILNNEVLFYSGPLNQDSLRQKKVS